MSTARSGAEATRKPALARKRALTRLWLVSAAWCGLLAWVVGSGRSAHGVPSALREFYYAFEIVFLPLVVAVQLALGERLLRRANVSEPTRTAADALALPAMVLVGSDLVLMSVGHPGGLSFAPQLAAAALGLAILRRASGAWRLSVGVWLAQAIPALLLVR